MFDVLIIGSGGAGLSAAIEASRNKSSVAVISKTYPTHSQTSQAQGGINAVTNKNDSVEDHINDTFKASKHLASKTNISLLCEKAKESIDFLNDLGLPFSKTNEGEYAQKKMGAASFSRACYSSDYSGLKILHTLYDQCIKRNIRFYNEYLLLNIIKKKSSAIGVCILNIETSEISEVYAKSIILCTGGYAGIYDDFTTNSYASTGDGIIAALNIGCELSNMEFVQFHPTSMKETKILISESARGEGAYLVNVDGNRFIDELKPRDEVARAINEQILQGKKVFLDLRHLGIDKINDLMPQERRLAYEFANVKIESELLEITPAAHYSMGGIKVNVSCETNITNLYACGECSQAGVHGANRLGGNSLLEIITFGRIAGLNASNNAKESIFEKHENYQLKNSKKSINDIFNHSNEINFYKIKDDLSLKLKEYMGLLRNKNGLKLLEEYILYIEDNLNKMEIQDKSKTYNKNLIDFLEFKNILQISKVMTHCALRREESRGSHYRSDFLHENKNFEKESIIQLHNHSLEFYFKEVS